MVLGCSVGWGQGDVALPEVAAEAEAAIEQVWQEADGWVKVHAGEVWIELGEGDRIRRETLAALPEWEAGVSRVGAWRMLARSAPDWAERQRWVAKVAAVVLDESAEDRVQAIETLGKLGEAGSAEVQAVARGWAAGTDGRERFFGQFYLAANQDPAAARAIVDHLTAEDALLRLWVGFALSRVGATDPSVLRRLAQAAEAEAVDARGYAHLMVAALMLGADPDREAAWRQELTAAWPQLPANGRLEAVRVMRQWTTVEQALERRPELATTEGDARLAAGWLILHAVNCAR